MIKPEADENNTDVFGLALIGAGMIAERHVMALSAMGGRARLIAIMSRHPERAKNLASSYEGSPPLFTSDLSEITGNPEVQIVVVATPPNVRIDLITKLAAAGKHILLEKPVARNVEEALEVAKVCERAGVKLGVLFQHRMRESSLRAKQILESGTLGLPGHIEIAVPLWRAQSYYDELQRGTYARDGGGVLITQAIHTIDLVLSLAGPVSRVQAMIATTPLHQMESEDLAVAGLHFESGAVGSFVASTATYPHGRETIIFHCQNGSMKIDAEAVEIAWRTGDIERYPSLPKNGSTLVATPKHKWHQKVIEDFIDAVLQDRDPMVTGTRALDSHRLIEAIEVSSRDGVAVDPAS